ncbi:F1/F0 ATPase, Methanosarcina type, subunit 2 [Hartmannibacter diazotrophicus]|uniref:F1/F0 ATPase, Methanosarcina type, subunit 2 n=1 Tax=Hartmannibacter diazotrophicus TaxID=1482074 RepID=A0A2C9D4C4_9HYPH|nr:ATP synthase subunit I [Hartmannibacter diazotrophicus]SON55134.1 F1/F0 ATPase, Methanosarcina type, subunit 2 [Hartmannibacter diazotrophicus]
MLTLPAILPELPLAAGLAIGGVFGLLVGLAYFGSLTWTVDCFAEGRAGRALVLQLLRFLLLAGGLVLMALLGATALISSAIGITVARMIVLRRRGTTA